MKLTTKAAFILVASLAFAGLTTTAEAAGRGVALAPHQLSAKQRATLMTSINTAKVKQPKAFGAVKAVRAKVGELDARKRGRFAPIGRHFKAE